MTSIVFRFLAASAVLLSACDGPVDDLPDGGGDACVGASDGTACDGVNICLSGRCVPTRCGDGYVDVVNSEECDDGNATANDGCQPTTCSFTCASDAQCADTVFCNGEETCDLAMHVCVNPEDVAPGTDCTIEAGADGVCARGACVPPGCGNGAQEPGEDCDDGDMNEFDGCRTDCRFSCELDGACQDETVCNGVETCDLATHACVDSAPMDCDDADACTADSCDMALGCANVLVDGDGDGQAATSIGSCGTDCDDGDDEIFMGAGELCDGADNDCDTAIDEAPPSWYPDCDRDGYSTGTTITGGTGCAPTTSAPASCPAGGWTTRAGSVAQRDCADNDPTRYPGADDAIGSGVDEDCDGIEICYADADGDGHRTNGTFVFGTGDGDCSDTGEAFAIEMTGDCCDTDGNAYPGQTRYYGSPRGGCGSFDYNCDGMLTQQFTTVFTSPSEDCTAHPECAGGAWYSSVQPCGVSGTFRQCYVGSSECTLGSTTSLNAPCR